MSSQKNEMFLIAADANRQLFGKKNIIKGCCRYNKNSNLKRQEILWAQIIGTATDFKPPLMVHQ